MSIYLLVIGLVPLLFASLLIFHHLYLKLGSRVSESRSQERLASYKPGSLRWSSYAGFVVGILGWSYAILAYYDPPGDYKITLSRWIIAFIGFTIGMVLFIESRSTWYFGLTGLRIQRWFSNIFLDWADICEIRQLPEERTFLLKTSGGTKVEIPDFLEGIDHLILEAHRRNPNVVSNSLIIDIETKVMHEKSEQERILSHNKWDFVINQGLFKYGTKLSVIGAAFLIGMRVTMFSSNITLHSILVQIFTAILFGSIAGCVWAVIRWQGLNKNKQER